MSTVQIRRMFGPVQHSTAQNSIEHNHIMHTARVTSLNFFNRFFFVSEFSRIGGDRSVENRTQTQTYEHAHTHTYRLEFGYECECG